MPSSQKRLSERPPLPAADYVSPLNRGSNPTMVKIIASVAIAFVNDASLSDTCAVLLPLPVTRHTIVSERPKAAVHLVC
jgi:hypothetical protein